MGPPCGTQGPRPGTPHSLLPLPPSPGADGGLLCAVLPDLRKGVEEEGRGLQEHQPLGQSTAAARRRVHRGAQAQHPRALPAQALPQAQEAAVARVRLVQGRPRPSGADHQFPPGAPVLSGFPASCSPSCAWLFTLPKSNCPAPLQAPPWASSTLPVMSSEHRPETSMSSHSVGIQHRSVSTGLECGDMGPPRGVLEPPPTPEQLQPFSGNARPGQSRRKLGHLGLNVSFPETSFRRHLCIFRRRLCVERPGIHFCAAEGHTFTLHPAGVALDPVTVGPTVKA